MALLRVVDRDGVEHEVDAKTGLKVMENLRELDYGVAAICGGMCSCATCHVYVDPEWSARLPAMMSDERELLTELSHYQENSRLSCQLEFTPELAGLRVTHRARRVRAARMSTPSVQVETRGAVALVTLNRPESANTLNLQMAMDLLAAAHDLRPQCRGARGRADRRRPQLLLRRRPARHGRRSGAGGDDYMRELTTYLHAAISHFVRMDAPVIAAVNGTAAGAGVGLVAMADLAVCGRSSKFNLAYTRRGSHPGCRHLVPVAAHRRRQAHDGAAAAQPHADGRRGARLGTGQRGGGGRAAARRGRWPSPSSSRPGPRAPSAPPSG